jgi:tetratricopeptide (TPR) repeat protein
MGGDDKIHAIKSLNYAGTYREGHYEGGAHMTRMRPNKRLVGCVPQVCNGKADQYLEIFDGERGWEVNLKRQRLIQMKRKAELAGRCGAEEFFPIFVDYKQKGFTAEFIGEETIKGAKTWAVKITPKRCNAKTFYFDQKTYMPIADRADYNVHARGAARDQLHLMSDYGDVAGVKIPFGGEEVDFKTGEHISGGDWAQIEANTVTDESVFTPPAVHPDEGTRLVLDMLEASETKPGKDVVTMYTNWRSQPKNQAVNMENNLTFLGYELLKADRFDSAIPLLETLVREYPNNAANYDSLGDGYMQQGDKAKAAAAFRKAVELDPKMLDTKAKLERLEK